MKEYTKRELLDVEQESILTSVAKPQNQIARNLIVITATITIIILLSIFIVQSTKLSSAENQIMALETEISNLYKVLPLIPSLLPTLNAENIGHEKKYEIIVTALSRIEPTSSPTP